MTTPEDERTEEFDSPDVRRWFIAAVWCSILLLTACITPHKTAAPVLPPPPLLIIGPDIFIHSAPVIHPPPPRINCDGYVLETDRNLCMDKI